MQDGKVLIGLKKDKYFCLKLEGDVRVPWCVSLETHCEAVIKEQDLEEICVDLTSADNLDSTTLGVLAKLAILSKNHCNKKAILFCDNENIHRLISSMGFAQVFDIRNGKSSLEYHFDALPFVDCSDIDMQDSVIDAHRTLMDINDENRSTFANLVDALENDKKNRYTSQK